MSILVENKTEYLQARRRPGTDGRDRGPVAASRTRSLAPRLADFAVAGLTAVGVAARFYTSSKLWLDEALSVNIASLPLSEVFPALRQDGHPPLYYVLLHFWMMLVGSGDVAVRALSGIFGVAALPLSWVAGRRLAGRSGARWALLVVALSPYCVRYSTETRMYSLVMFLVLGGYLLLADALRSPAVWRFVGLTLVSGLLLLSHYWSFWLLGSVALMLIWRCWRIPHECSRSLCCLAAVAAGGVMFVPWLGSFLHQTHHTGTPWGEPFGPFKLLSVTFADMFGSAAYSKGVLASYLAVVLLLVALFVVRVRGREVLVDLYGAPPVCPEIAMCALTAALGWAASEVAGAAYQSRYAAVFVPLLLISIAVGIARMPGVPRVALGGLLLGLSLLGIRWINHQFERTQSSEVVAAIIDVARPGDVVVYCPDQLGPAYAREMPEGLVELAYPTLEDPDRIDWVDYAERNSGADPEQVAGEVQAVAGDRTIFVVWNAGFRTFDKQCERLVAAAGAGRSRVHVVRPNPGRYFEPAYLTALRVPEG